MTAHGHRPCGRTSFPHSLKRRHKNLRHSPGQSIHCTLNCNVASTYQHFGSYGVWYVNLVASYGPLTSIGMLLPVPCQVQDETSTSCQMPSELPSRTWSAMYALLSETGMPSCYQVTASRPLESLPYTGLPMPLTQGLRCTLRRRDVASGTFHQKKKNMELVRNQAYLGLHLMSGAFEITPAFIYDVWIQRAAVAAGYTLLLYDYFLTLGDEVEYIWKAPWTPVKSVYLANRYTMLLGQTVICIQETGVMAAVTGGCRAYAIFLGVFTLVSLETAHVLVVFRAWAIWGGNRLILRSVVMGYVACLVSLIVAVGKGEDFSNFEPNVKFVCYEPAPDRAWLFYFGSLVVDSLFFCMTMSGLWSYRKSFSRGSLDLIKALMRNVTIFYIVNVCYDVLGIVSMTTYQNSPIALGVSAIMAPVLAICGQRVVHDLRRMAPVSWSARELSDVVDQQLEAFQFWAQSAGNGASMALEGLSAVEGETGSNIDEISVATGSDTEPPADDDAGISMGIPSFESMSYSPATSLGTSVSLKAG